MKQVMLVIITQVMANAPVSLYRVMAIRFFRFFPRSNSVRAIKGCLSSQNLISLLSIQIER